MTVCYIFFYSEKVTNKIVAKLHDIISFIGGLRCRPYTCKLVDLNCNYVMRQFFKRTCRRGSSLRFLLPWLARSSGVLKDRLGFDHETIQRLVSGSPERALLWTLGSRRIWVRDMLSLC